MDREERVRQRAYAMWEQDGCPAGRDAEYWLRACDEVDGTRQGGEGADEAEAANENAARQRMSGRDQPSGGGGLGDDETSRGSAGAGASDLAVSDVGVASNLQAGATIPGGGPGAGVGSLGTGGATTGR
jgi:hypothetical protein